MNITVFGKKRTTKEGKPFMTYFTKLEKKDGSEITAQVKFTEEAGNPKTVPCNLVIDKKNANYVEKTEKYIDAETQQEKETIRKTLWVSAWKEGKPYVDTSLDAFVD